MSSNDYLDTPFQAVEDTTLGKNKKEILGYTSTSTSGKVTTAVSFKDIVGERMVATHDNRGVELSFGNRALRRTITKNRGSASGPKQYHKQGH